MLPGHLFISQRFIFVEALAQASTVLILLAAGLLVYRTFRERYLLTWNLGWLAYLGYKLAIEASGVERDPSLWQVLAHAAFLVAACLFAASVYLYTNHRRRTLPMALIAFIAFYVAVFRVLVWPQSQLAGWLVQVLFLAITVTAAVHLAWFSRGRRMTGPWLLAVSLLFLRVHGTAEAAHRALAADIAVELGLGLSLLLTVMDDAQARLGRFRAINAIAAAVGEARELSPMMRTALEELRRVVDAKAAWFRSLDGDSLVLGDYLGLSAVYVKSRAVVPLQDSLSGRVLKERVPGMIRARATDSTARERLRHEGFEHVVVIPVQGKTQVVGTVSLGSCRSRSYTAGEMQFLAASVNQLGIAVENLRMFERMAHSQRQWASTFDSIEDAIFVHANDGAILRANRAFLQRLGKTYPEVIGRACRDVMPRARDWNDCPYCSAAYYSTGDLADPCFGGLSLVSSSSYSEGTEQRGTVHVVRDITERHAAEERYRLLFEQVQEGVFVSSPEGRILDCNEAFVRMLGYGTRDEVMALDIARDLYEHPGERDQHVRRIGEERGVRNLEFTLRRKDGSRVAVLETSFPTFDAQGRIVRLQGFLLDITQKKRAEEETGRRNRELYALNSIAVVAGQSLDLDEILNVTLRHVVNLFSADVAGIYLLDQSSGVLHRRAAHGYRSAAGKQSDIALPPDFLERVARSRTEVMNRQHLPHLPTSIIGRVEAEQLHSWLWVVMWAKDKIIGAIAVSSRSPREFTSTDENLMVAVGRQLATTIDKVRLYEETSRAYDDLRRTQEQLLQSEKMSAVGQLISGVAHELNNPLTAILGYAQLLENEPLEDRTRDFVQKMYKQAQRTHRIVQNLLSFARQRKPEKKPVDLRRVIEDTLALRDYDLRLNNIAVERDLDPRLPAVVADAHQLEQVFLNLVNNAVDAMLEHAPGGALKVRAWAEHGRVRAEVRDSGPGLRDPKRVFDPFYTTKPVGKGTGLGLSICYGIVKEHGGEIVGSNHPDGGAVFCVSLPVAAHASEHASQHIPHHHPLLSGRVLIVDDEDAVLDFEREVLSGAGAEVVAINQPTEAIARLQREAFDVILIDAKMPGGWTGPDLYRWVREHCPGMEKRIVIAISDVADPRMRHFIESSGVLCIPKPFEVSDLIAIVRRALMPSHSQAAAVAAEAGN